MGPPIEGFDRRSLTSDNLSRIPRRNYILFLSNYLREQQTYAKEYVSEGLRVSSSSNCNSDPSNQKSDLAAPALLEFHLETPVLKPRVPILEKSSTILKTADCVPLLTKSVNEDHTRRDSTTWKPVSKLPELNVFQAGQRREDEERTRRQTKKPKKRKEGGDCEEDHLKRLQERRERKRRRKNIMKSPITKLDSEQGKNKSPHPSVKKGTKTKKGKSQASFALMHGFFATNVGKSRITLEPHLGNVGVFKKGKASCALKVSGTTTKKQSDGVCFSETAFLGRTKPKPNNAVDCRSVSTSSSSAGSEDKMYKKEVTVKHSRQGTVYIESEDSNCSDIAVGKEGPSPKVVRRPYDPADSIVWDIENKSLDSDAGRLQSTIILDLTCDGPTLEHLKQEGHLDLAAGSGSDISGNSVDIDAVNASLHPSQSASQIIDHGKSNLAPVSSKYFDGHIDLNRYESEPHQKSSGSMTRSPLRNFEIALDSPTLSRDRDSITGLSISYAGFSGIDYCGSFLCSGTSQIFGSWSNDGECIEPDLESLNAIIGHHNVASGPSDNIGFGGATPFYVEGSCDFLAEGSWDPFVDAADGEDTGFSKWDVRPSMDADSDDGIRYTECNNFSKSSPSDFSNFTPDVGSLSGGVRTSPKVDRFSQGRSLLYGLDCGDEWVLDAEAEVAKRLHAKHWLPLRL